MQAKGAFKSGLLPVWPVTFVRFKRHIDAFFHCNIMEALIKHLEFSFIVFDVLFMDGVK